MLSVDTGRLQGMAVFQGIDSSKLKLIAMVGNRLEFAAGTKIVSAGDPSQAVYIILEGEVQIARESHQVLVPVGRRGVGYIVGDIAVVLSEPYPATISAVDEVVALRLDAHTFLELVQEVPQLALALLRDFGRRVISVATAYADTQV